MSSDLNHIQRLWTWDNEKYRAAGERRNEHGRKVAEVTADVERQINLKPITAEQSKEINQAARKLREQDRIVRQIERLRDRDIDTYYERGFDRVYSHLTSTT